MPAASKSVLLSNPEQDVLGDRNDWGWEILNWEVLLASELISTVRRVTVPPTSFGHCSFGLWSIVNYRRKRRHRKSVIIRPWEGVWGAGAWIWRWGQGKRRITKMSRISQLWFRLPGKLFSNFGYLTIRPKMDGRASQFQSVKVILPAFSGDELNPEVACFNGGDSKQIEKRHPFFPSSEHTVGCCSKLSLGVSLWWVF